MNKEQFISEIKNKRFEDLKTDIEIKVYKELYPEYKNRADKVKDEIEFFLMLPILLIVMPFIWVFRPRKR